MSPAPASSPADTAVTTDAQTAVAPAARPERLWREVVGDELRAVRQTRGESLRRVATRARVSPQYLSEMERGRKDPSSEMLAAACGSLGLSLGEFARRSALAISAPASSPTGPVLLAA